MSNIIGEGFDPFVNEQINTRQRILGSVNKSPEQIVWENSKTSFIKLVSSADLINLTSSFDGGFTEGKQLAEKYVLFNGVTNEIPSTNRGIETFQRSGIDTRNVAVNRGAYGLGGTEWGLQPMPGIISADIKSETMGSLRTGTVQIKANNKSQFDIISTLYLRIGYTMLLEWGNTSYFNNDGVYITDNITSLADSFLSKRYNFKDIKDEVGADVTYNNLLTAVSIQQKISNGNYDALIGKVVNYSWVFNRDGSYTITIILRSAGDVIEALKTNILLPGALPATATTTENTPSTSKTAEETIIAFAQSSTIGAKFAEIQKLIPSDGYFNKSIGGLNVYPLKTESSTVDYFSQKYNSGQTQYFVRFGTFLKLLEDTAIPVIENGKEKIIKVGDINSEKILIYSPPRQVPSDPRICAFKKETESGTIYPGISDFIFKQGENQYGKLMFCYFNMVFILQLLEDLKDKDGRVSIVSLLNSLMNGFCKATGNFNSITPKIDYNTNTIIFIDKTALPDRESLIINKKSTKFNVYGLETVSGSIVGGSFIRDMQLKTEITPDLANMITIGATSAGYVTGTDAIAISNLTKGTQDRIKPIISSPTSTKLSNEKENKEIVDTYQEAVDAFYTFLSTITVSTSNTGPSEVLPTWNEDAFTNFTSTQRQLLEYDQKQSTTSARNIDNPYAASPNSGFLPFNLTLTMDGLSGMKIYNKFFIDSKFLPENYPDSMEFVIMNVSHSIQNNIWVTVITSVAIPRYPIGTKYVKPSLTQKSRRQEPIQSPLPYTNDPKLSDIRNAIVRIARSYVGQIALDGDKGFANADFQSKMQSVGWGSGNAWCNYFADLVWKEAYQEVGAKDAKIQSIFQNTFKSFNPNNMPLTGHCPTTFANMRKLGYAEVYIPGKTIIKPGDMVFYNCSHISIAGVTDNKGFESIDGNYGVNQGGSVKNQAKRTEAYAKKYLNGIGGIIRVVE